MRFLVVGWVAIGACVPAPERIAPTSPRLVPSPASDGPVAFVPVHDPAGQYNDAPAPVPHSPLSDAVAAAVGEAAARAGWPIPEADARLFRACADLAEVAPDEGFAGATLDDEVVQFALHRNGIIEPTVRLLFGWGRHQIEITASDELGPTVLANFPVWCAVEPPMTIRAERASRAGGNVDAGSRAGDASPHLDRARERDRGLQHRSGAPGVDEQPGPSREHPVGGGD